MLPDLISPDILALLLAVAALAGLIDAIAGGGGLLTLPALLWAGVPPLQALATNKLQGSFGTATAAAHFLRRGEISLEPLWPAVLLTFIGASAGTLTVGRLTPGLLENLVPLLLMGFALYFLFSPQLARISHHSPTADADTLALAGRTPSSRLDVGSATPAPSSGPCAPPGRRLDALATNSGEKYGLGDEDRHQRLGRWPFALTIGFGIGFYDGFFGPGTGSFFAAACVLLLGYNLKRATAATKLLNFTSNIAALLFFALGGHVLWSLGLAMGLAQTAGAWLGSHLVIRHGARVIRPLLVVVSLAVSLKLLLT